MARTTLSLKLKIEADYQTIQAIKKVLAGDQATQRLADQLRAEVLRTLAVAGIEEEGYTLEVTLKVSPASETKKGPKSVPPPVVREDQLILWDHELDRQIDTIRVGGRFWLPWLENEGKSFRYESGADTFTAIKEKRGNRRVWYAHRRTEGNLKRAYLGKSENLTKQKLWEAAHKLSQLALPIEGE